jgi:hypothetical protein
VEKDAIYCENMWLKFYLAACNMVFFKRQIKIDNMWLNFHLAACNMVFFKRQIEIDRMVSDEKKWTAVSIEVHVF